MTTDDLLKICLYGGSFDPFHKGHLWIVNHLIHQFHSHLIIIPTFTAPTYTSKPSTLAPPLKTHQLDFDTRLKLIGLSLQDLPCKSYVINDVEKTLRHTHTYHVVTHLGHNQPWWVMGQDQLMHFDQWHEAHKLITSVRLCVFPRPPLCVSYHHTYDAHAFLQELTEHAHQLIIRLNHLYHQSWNLILTHSCESYDLYDLKTLTPQEKPSPHALSQIILMKNAPPTVSSTNIRARLFGSTQTADHTMVQSEHAYKDLAPLVKAYFQNQTNHHNTDA